MTWDLSLHVLTDDSVADTQLMTLTGGDVARTWAAKSDAQVRAAARAALREFVAAGW